MQDYMTGNGVASGPIRILLMVLSQVYFEPAAPIRRIGLKATDIFVKIPGWRGWALMRGPWWGHPDLR
jgi:hypothetical protein